MKIGREEGPEEERPLEPAAVAWLPIAGVDNEEQGQSIWVCRGPK